MALSAQTGGWSKGVEAAGPWLLAEEPHPEITIVNTNITPDRETYRASIVVEVANELKFNLGEIFEYFIQRSTAS